jgi:phosphate acetyltransferase
VSIAERWTEEARAAGQTIVLPEGEEPRVLRAANDALRLGICKVVLLGEEEKIRAVAAQEGIPVPDVPILFPTSHPRFGEFCDLYIKVRGEESEKVITAMMAEKMMANPLFFAAMMVRESMAGGVVAGTINTTANVVRAARFIIGMQPGVNDVSSVFVMQCRDRSFGDDGVLVFADCGVMPDPTAEQLAEIAIASAASARSLVGCEPRVALLSFSTRGSASHARVDKVRRAAELVAAKCPDLLIDGALQADAAIVPGVASRKAADSPLKGQRKHPDFPGPELGEHCL